MIQVAHQTATSLRSFLGDKAGVWPSLSKRYLPKCRFNRKYLDVRLLLLKRMLQLDVCFHKPTTHLAMLDHVSLPAVAVGANFKLSYGRRLPDFTAVCACQGAMRKQNPQKIAHHTANINSTRLVSPFFQEPICIICGIVMPVPGIAVILHRLCPPRPKAAD